MRLLLSAGFIALMFATAAAAGPWPRGEGKVFLSVGYEGQVDLDQLPLVAITQGGTLYAEYGVGTRTTLGLDVFTDFQVGHSAILFLRRTVTAGHRTNQFAVSLGAGRRSDRTGRQSLVSVGASWGRGFSSRWSEGWATIETQAQYWDRGELALKLDATLGLKPSADWMLIGQAQFADYPGADTTARIQASVVRHLGKRLSIEMGVVAGVMNDKRAGLTVKLWSAF